MDTSETYIKMCDCEEVQEHCKYDGGDWICDPDNGHSWAIWQKVRGKTDEEVQKFMDGLLWLPGQDRIQEMLYVRGSKVIDPLWELVNRFYGFVYREPPSELWGKFKGETMEQLWLAFYMHEKHQKTWDGDKWVSNK